MIGFGQGEMRSEAERSERERGRERRNRMECEETKRCRMK